MTKLKLAEPALPEIKPNVPMPEVKAPKEEDPRVARQRDTQERRSACMQELTELLARYRMRLVPFLLPPEQVGAGMLTKMQVTAAVDLIPEN